MTTPNESRTYVVLTPAERGKLKALGGSAWLRRVLAEQPEPDNRPACAVPEHERVMIASESGPAKLIARRHRVSVDFVYHVRKISRYAKPQPAALPGVSHTTH